MVEPLVNSTERPSLVLSAKVHGTEILATDTRQQYREKIARITLDSMVQFVGLLDAHGIVLEINKVALDAVGIGLSDVEGKPFWTSFWWQVSWSSGSRCIARWSRRPWRALGVSTLSVTTARTHISSGCTRAECSQKR